MTHFTTAHQEPDSTMNILRTARDLMPGHTLRIFLMAFGLSLLGSMLAALLNADPNGSLSNQVGFLLASLVSLALGNSVLAQTANIAVANDIHNESEFEIESSRFLNLIGLNALLLALSIPLVTLGIFTLKTIGLMIAVPLFLLLGALALPIYWLAPLAIMEHNLGPIDAIKYIFDGLKGRHVKAVSTLGVSSLIATLISLSLIGVVWAVPFGYFVAAVVYTKLVVPGAPLSLNIQPTIQIQMPAPRRVVRER